MGTQQSNLQAEMAAMATVNDNGLAAVLVGATPSIAFALPMGSVAPAYAISRQPAGGTAVLNAASGLFTSGLNVAGLYVATGANGGIVRTVNIVAVPAGVLLMPAGSGKVSLQHVLSMLTATQSQWSAATFAASVENANFGGTAQAPGGGFGFNPVLLGGSNAALSLSLTPYGN